MYHMLLIICVLSENFIQAVSYMKISYGVLLKKKRISYGVMLSLHPFVHDLSICLCIDRKC